MRVLVDTNVWVDIALDRKEHVQDSQGAVGVCLLEGIELFVAGTSLKDTFYIADRSAGTKRAYESIETILQIAKVISIDDAVCHRALDLEKPDYEDGMIAAAALLNKVDAVISRDGQAFKSLEVPKYSPKEFIAQQGYTEVEL